MTKHKKIFLSIVILTVISILIDLPKIPIKFSKGPVKINTVIGGYDIDWSFFGIKIKRDLKIKKGLDIAGGVRVVLKTKMAEVSEDDRDSALESARQVIERRVNFFGVSEPNIQTSRTKNDYRIIVELPGVTDTAQAIELIGKTAQLDFRESKEATPSSMASFVKTGLTGKDLKKAGVVFDNQTNQPQVSLEFTDEGAKKFEAITKRNVDKMLAIFLDNKLLSAPRVDEPISGGKAVIRGGFDVEQAKQLSIQLNAGALPVPIEILSQENIGATLGKNSVQKSITAGFIGLVMVGFFMTAIYGKLGLLATIGLIIYGIITLALYKLIPVTLTLSGIAGFLLSIGMAVDANILIFERLKEEKRAGKALKPAIETAFGRAWDSIRDANVCTLITSFILFNPFNWLFLNVSGMVRGFALTLGLGIAISLFTGIVATRTLIRVFYR